MLTGSAATEAIQLYTSIGERSFDARKVASAVRTSAGRARLKIAVSWKPLRGLLSGWTPKAARRERRTVRASLRGSCAAARGPSRPRQEAEGV